MPPLNTNFEYTELWWSIYVNESIQCPSTGCACLRTNKRKPTRWATFLSTCWETIARNIRIKSVPNDTNERHDNSRNRKLYEMSPIQTCDHFSKSNKKTIGRSVSYPSTVWKWFGAELPNCSVYLVMKFDEAEMNFLLKLNFLYRNEFITDFFRWHFSSVARSKSEHHFTDRCK